MRIALLTTFVLFSIASFSQNKEDEEVIRSIFDKALSEGQSYEMLDYLSNEIGGRLSGSPEAAAAVEWSRNVMVQMGFDNVFLQDVMVPHWVRGKKEVARAITTNKGSFDLRACALGNSIGTGEGGIVANLIEVQSFEELKEIGREEIQGKIVYFSRPMDPTQIQTFRAYGGAVNQRGAGASEAAKYGAIGVVIRSMASNVDDYPHTGSLRYALNVPKIPAIAISTRDAVKLSALLKEDPNLNFYFETHSKMLEDAPSHNVIGELEGKKSNSYIVVGGHLDSWDLGDGSHDDGAGCVQSIEALRILKEIGYKPNNTLRAVMFMNEENGLRGGRKYAELAEKNKEAHVAAMESDRGGFVPRGFSMAMDDDKKAIIQSWATLFEPYGITDFSQTGGGADISPLRPQGVPQIGLLPDSQRYFNYHHSENDTFDKVDKRELELGAAAMASLIYLIDKYGLN